MNLPLFISRRIYSAQENDRRKVSRPAIRIATAGVAIGLAVMIVSVSVVFGFKHTIRDKIVGFGSHIQVADFMTLQTSETQPIQMDDSIMNVLRKQPGVKHVQRYAMTQGILKTDNEFLGVMFKGVGPEFDSTFIHKNMHKLGLKCGERIFAYFINQDGVRMRRFTVSGIYRTNLTQYDNTICFTDLYTTVKLNGWNENTATGAEISVNDFDRMKETEDAISRNVNRTTDSYGHTYTSKNIKELNRQIFSWLELLDLNVWIILAIMTAVAGVTMISGLLIIILERTSMIGLLKALGARNRMIRHTFLWFAAFIISKGLIIGNILGIGIILLQKFTGVAKLDPATYYVNTVPAELNPLVIIMLNAMTMLVCIFVLIAPSYLIAHIHPARSMRYE